MPATIVTTAAIALALGAATPAIAQDLVDQIVDRCRAEMSQYGSAMVKA
jgi:hypothetical protein